MLVLGLVLGWSKSRPDFSDADFSVIWYGVYLRKSSLRMRNQIRKEIWEFNPWLTDRFSNEKEFRLFVWISSQNIVRRKIRLRVWFRILMIERLWRWCSSEMVFPHPKKSLQNSRENDFAMMISIEWYKKWNDRDLSYCFVILAQAGIYYHPSQNSRLHGNDSYKRSTQMRLIEKLLSF